MEWPALPPPALRVPHTAQHPPHTPHPPRVAHSSPHPVARTTHSASRITRFHTFALLYMTAIVLDVAPSWPMPRTAFVMIPILLFAARTRTTAVPFLLFLTVSTVQILRRFPDIANHENLLVYLNAVIGFAIVRTWVRRRSCASIDATFEVIRPLVQIATIVMYVMAGFHKLNADFFDPAVSCAATFARDLSAAFGGAALTSMPPPLSIAVVGLATVVVAWELAGGALLTVPRLQAPVLALSWLMHATFALISFVDFGAIVLALLFTFVPQPYFDLLNRPVKLPVLGAAVRRLHMYVGVNIGITLLKAIPPVGQTLRTDLYDGLLFNASALFLIWPLIACVARRDRPRWTGVPISARPWMLMLSFVLVFHGMTGYLGLRTTGNFSMFSNLRTEGLQSNHFLLGSNPVKIWNYQEDVVEIIDIDPQYANLRGRHLPIVEFRKRIARWTKSGRVVPARFVYRGQRYDTPDLAQQPMWRTPQRDWTMVLMDFRPIQPSGANRCRW